VFKGQFTITRGLAYKSDFEKHSSKVFKEGASSITSRLDSLFNVSHHGKAYLRSQVIAIERPDQSDRITGDSTVHFDLHFAPRSRPPTNAADLYVILGDEMLSHRHGTFVNLTLDPNSLNVQERVSSASGRGLFYSASSSFPVTAFFTRDSRPWTSVPRFPGLLAGLGRAPGPPPRRCSPVTLDLCSSSSYNQTSYPNLLGHWNSTSLEAELISFRQIMDSECFVAATDFLCRLLQPECVDDEVVWPCRNFCQQFVDSCHQFITKDIRERIKCPEFPVFKKKSPVLEDSNKGLFDGILFSKNDKEKEEESDKRVCSER